MPDVNQPANSARQMFVAVVPPAIQNRARADGPANDPVNSQTTRNFSRSQNRGAPAAPTEAKARDDKSLAQEKEKMDEPSPALVRMLIVIEREPQGPQAPDAKKGPSGGAS
jgi:hypothetical protein